MAEITIIKGEEFKIAVKKEITREDFFVEQYKRAADMLDRIVGTTIEVRGEKEAWKSQDFGNNIIAFCGERGEGKSSVMMTFVNAVYENRNNDIFSNCENLKSTYFAEPVLIDPSLFDDVHNVLDIVLAKIFRKFYDSYNNDNQCVDERTREKLIDRFQKVYRYVSLINNQKQMLDDEFDYEGNISKLTKLGESTKLKEELTDLIKDYLDFMETHQGKKQLIIAIDDLDLCNANAYKMAEQIRKYLIIPHVCIVISVKIEQLELCIREKNLKEFKEVYKNRDEEIYNQLNKEVQTMAERYVSKLIPRQRRIYLPKVQRFEDVRIIYKEADSKENILDSWNIGGSNKKESLDEQTESNRAGYRNRRFTLSMLDLIYERTGMRFWPEADGSSYLLPDNLRDMISWILMVAEMEEPEDVTDQVGDKIRDKVYFENIMKLENFFTREWIGDNLKPYGGLTLQDIGNMDTFHLHVTVQGIMNKMYREISPGYVSPFPNYMPERSDTFFQIMGYFETINKSVVDMEKEAAIYRICALYTIRIHKLLRSRQYEELTDFFNGYIWGPSFYGFLPMQSGTNADRSRFIMRTIDSFNLILRKINDTAGELPVPKAGKQYYVSHITRKEERNSYLNAWIVLGLFSNIFYFNNGMQTFSFNGKIISDNNQIWDYIQISLENYLVALCNLDVLYDKIDLQRLGVETDEFKKYVNVLKNKNQDSIQYAREIVANMDLLIGLREFCIKNRDYKGSTSGGEERTRKLVERFLENIEKYMDQYGIKIEADKLKYFTLEDNQVIEISQLYSELFSLSMQNDDFQQQLEQEQKQAGLVAEFRRKITDLPTSWNHEVNKASSYLVNQSAKNAKYNLDRFALRVQRYLGENKKPPEHLDVEGLCALYSSVMKMYFKDKNANLTQDLCDEYRRLVKVQDGMKAGDE